MAYCTWQLIKVPLIVISIIILVNVYFVSGQQQVPTPQAAQQQQQQQQQHQQQQQQQQQQHQQPPQQQHQPPPQQHQPPPQQHKPPPQQHQPPPQQHQPPPQQHQPPPQQHQQPPQQQQQQQPPQQHQQQPPQQHQQPPQQHHQPPPQQHQQPPPQQHQQPPQQHQQPPQQIHQQPPQQIHQQPPQVQQQPPQHYQPQQGGINQQVGLGEHPAAWYDSLPAVAMDYKVHIDAGKEDCYWQYVRPGSTFYVSFQVIRGGDGMAGFAVRHPHGQIVHPYQWQQSSEYTDQSSTGGYYAVCVDNQFSRFAAKLVNIYLTVIRYEEWDQYAKEIEALQLNMHNFTEVISSVEKNMNSVLQFQSHTRNRESRDVLLTEDNYAYVQNWSIAQILVICLTSAVQVYFVRKLFDEQYSGHTKSRI